MATTATVVLRAAMPGDAGQSATLNWNGTTAVATFAPPLPAHDSGVTTIIKVGSKFWRNPWTASTYTDAPLGGRHPSFPFPVAPTPGEKVKEHSSLSDDEYMRLKMAQLQMLQENAPMSLGTLEQLSWFAQQPRSADLYGR